MGRVLNMDDEYIDKKLRENAMRRNMIKFWRVHFDEEDETESSGPSKDDPDLMKAQEIYERLQAEAAEDDAVLEREREEAYAAAAEDDAEAAWRARTGASGVYGQKPVEDEATQAQISAILGERENAFEDMIHGMQE